MKRSRTAALLLMGTAPLLLTACSEETTSEGLYTSVEECTAQTNDSYSCGEAFADAKKQAEVASPRYESREQCVAAHGADQCEQRTNAAGQSFFMPFMTGFLVAQMFRGGRSAGFAASPAFRDSAGNWGRPSAPAGGVYRPGSTGSTAMTSIAAKPNVAPTVSRGGFGSSNSQRSGSSGS